MPYANDDPIRRAKAIPSAGASSVHSHTSMTAPPWRDLLASYSRRHHRLPCNAPLGNAHDRSEQRAFTNYIAVYTNIKYGIYACIYYACILIYGGRALGAGASTSK